MIYIAAISIYCLCRYILPHTIIYYSIVLHTVIYCYILLQTAALCNLLLFLHSAIYCHILLYTAIYTAKSCLMLLRTAFYCYIPLHCAIYCFIRLYRLLLRCVRPLYYLMLHTALYQRCGDRVPELRISWSCSYRHSRSSSGSASLPTY